MLRIMVNNMLQELGHRVIAEAYTCRRYCQLAGRPIIFISGYGSSGLSYRNLLARQKPFSVDALRLTIGRVMKDPAV
jgi:hypothetical protein